MGNKKIKPHTYVVIVYEQGDPEFRFLGVGQYYFSKQDRRLSYVKLYDFDIALNRYKKALRSVAPEADVEKAEKYLRAKYHELYPEAMF